jgi:hypothetical protein
MPPSQTEALLRQEVMSHPGNSPFGKPEAVRSLVDENGQPIQGQVYQTPDDHLVETINDYAATNGADNGFIDGFQFFTTRNALNNFLTTHPDFQEKYGVSNPGADISYIFAGAANPGWEGTSYTPVFTLDRKPTSVQVPAEKMADVVYWHEISHLPPILNLSTDEGESRAWEYGFHQANIPGY